MTLEMLSDSLTKIVKKITFASLIDEKLIKEVVKDIQRALLTSDVNVKLVMDLSKTVEDRALKEKPKPGLSKKEHILRIVYEELVALLGEKEEFLPAAGSRIMMVGLQGSGKTTTIVKLSKFLQKRGLRPYVIAADTKRPAAYEQLVQLSEPLNLAVYGEPENKNPIEILKKGLQGAKKTDLIILDTAGRHSSEKELFEEMKEILEVFKPDERLLVIDSSIGQQAGVQAQAFHEAVGITGVILTKLDGSAKGGGALSAVARTSSPIRFIGTGEKIAGLEPFDPDRFISRILGMGDLKTLMEKARELDELGKDQMENILKGEFTLVDLQNQILALRKMGPIGSIMKMIPGIGMSLPKEASQVTEEKMDKFMTIMNSMTAEEKNKPKIINSSRIRRIARGSGTKTEEIKELMTYYNTMKRALKAMMKGRFGKGPLARMMRGFR